MAVVAAGASHQTGSDGEHDIGGREQEPAADGEADLAEPVHENLDQAGVDQPADAETGDGEADQREAQPEAQAQIGADIGEGAPHERALDEGREDDDARERDCSARRRSRRRSRAADLSLARVAGLARQRIGDEFEHEARRRQREHAGEHEEHVAPAHQIAEHAAGGLAEQLAENLAGQVAAEIGWRCS